MTKRIIELAKQAGLFTHKEVQPELERFAALVRAAALEEAAGVCESISFNAMNDWTLKYQPVDQGRELGADECAEAIRALKEKT